MTSQLYYVNSDDKKKGDQSKLTFCARLCNYLVKERKVISHGIAKTTKELDVINFLIKQKLLWRMFKAFVPKHERRSMRRGSTF